MLLFVAADHYYEYAVRDYSVIPTIGTLFLLNFISAGAVGLLLLAPVERLSRRFGTAVLALAAASGAGIAATSLLALIVSEQTKLFGFMEQNYRPEILVAIVSEAAAALVLIALTALALSAARSDASQRLGRAIALETASLRHEHGAIRRGPADPLYTNGDTNTIMCSRIYATCSFSPATYFALARCRLGRRADAGASG